MKKLSVHIIFSILFIGVAFGKTNEQIEGKKKSESFVIKKKKKKKSKSKLQEKLCSSFANQMSTVPDVHKKIAELQQVLLDQTCKYLENEKCCMILNSDKKKIEATLEMAKDFESKISNFCSECDKYLEYLK